ncbi:cytosolic phospholipase A2 gamma-like [Chanos chanos]|uniref:Cytosolic phospholipase A2 gamma-like n=1 Tax=Chanos chanos TaxID=29144 RepID=A0A6J2WJA6_CHACN|nr:cytosolic phospholipase A2 gamma-like [Chanos chanos]
MSQSKLGQSEVRIGHSLNDGEKQHITSRKETVLKCLKRQGIYCSPSTVPKIALLGSGGGERAMVGLLGSLVQLEKCDLLDCMLYLSGVSGSTWCMTSLYKESNWSRKLEAIQNAFIKRLDRSGVSLWGQVFKLLEYFKKDNCSATDTWAAIIVSNVMREINEDTITDHRDNHGKDPYPVYTVIDKQCKYDRLSKDAWFEITPHEAGYSLTGAFVDSVCFGNQFENGKIIKEQPEIDMLYLQGLCGSALADMEEILKQIREWTKHFISYEQYSSPGCQVLLTLLELNICVLRDEDPTSLIATLNELLKGRLDKHGKEIFIMLPAEEKLSREKVKDYTLTICHLFWNWFGEMRDKIWMSVVQATEDVLQWTWGTTYNFLHGLTVEEVHPSVLNEKERYYIDAGLLINSPYFPMLRKERDIDLIISLDFSAGDPMETVLRTADMSKALKIPFPEVKLPDDTSEPDDFYVFEGHTKAPTVIHIPLFNKVNCDGQIKEWAERFKTFQGPYTHDMTIDLIKKAGENVLNTKEKILKQIVKLVEQKETSKLGK